MEMEEDPRLLIQFEGLDDAATNQAALALEEHLAHVTAGEIRTERRKARQGTQDAGTIIEILNTAVPLAIATGIGKGLHDFLRRRGSRITVFESGKIVATGDAASFDPAPVVAALQRGKTHES